MSRWFYIIQPLKHSLAVKEEFIWLLAFVGLYLGLAWLTDEAFGLLILFFIFYVLRQLVISANMERDLTKPLSEVELPTTGLWGVLSYQIYKQRRQLQKVARQAALESSQFKAASMALPFAILSITKKHRIEWFNQAGQSLLNLQPSDVGHRLEMMVREPSFIQYLKQQDYEQPLFLTDFMTKQRAYRCQIIPYNQSHWLVLFEDVHELYHISKIRHDFVANASHELRTPLTVLNGYLEAMADLPAETLGVWQKPVAQMSFQSQRMMNIVDDLLTLSKVESDVIMVESEKVNVSEMLESMIQEVQYLDQEKHQISVEIEPGLGILGQKNSLKSVFMNLISNAIRYTPEGGRIEVRWVKEAGQAVFSVKDNGEGIANEHLSRLTERFYRVDAARSREAGGTGLGLAIVKHILEHHDSKLDIQSLLGSGSTFSCRFDLKAKGL